MRKNYYLEDVNEKQLFEVEGGLVTTAPQLGIFVITEWLKSLFS